MDSVTQIALGASVAAAVGFKPFGRKVLLAGAMLGTLPDLDVFIDYGDAIDNYTSHRGFSHSLFVLTLFSLALYFSTLKLKPHFQSNKLALFLVIFLPLITHPLLDTFTTYGTQLLWPLTSPPIAWHSVFIIDPLYTLPLLATVLALWFSDNNKRWLQLNKLALLISCGYLGWGQFAQEKISARVQQEVVVQGGQLLVMPTPFNSVYWRVLSYHPDNYYEAFTYLGDQTPLKWASYSTNRDLVSGKEVPYLSRLEWFSHGWLRFDEVSGQLHTTDLRLGITGYHPFTFAIAKREGANWSDIEPQQIPIDDQKQQQLLETIKQKIGL